MPNGITYFCTDNSGNVYLRYSAGHIEPCYTHASIFRTKGQTTPASKAQVSYASDPSRARAEIRRRAYFTGAELVPVRAYPGRHKVEPVALAVEA